jgi:hypothetical protein
MNTAGRLVSLGVSVVALAAVPLAAQSGNTSQASTRQATVICVLGTRAFPFPAGNDRCFKEINGQKPMPASATVCAENTSSGPRLRFVYSSQPKAQCVTGIVAAKGEYDWGLAALGAQEKAFFLKHVDASAPGPPAGSRRQQPDRN